MAEDYMVACRCILCRRKYDASSEFKNITSTNVNSSKKSIKAVLTHLAKCIKTEVTLKDSAYVCGLCYEKLSEYDQIMLQLLLHQRKLSRMLETSINKLDFCKEEIKEECNESDVFLQSASDEDNNEDDDMRQDSEPDSLSTPPLTGFQCSICDKKLSSKYSLTAHLESHTKSKRCHICGVLRRDEEYLELHMNTHEGKSENECRYCPKRYSRRSNVIRHMHLHWDKKKFQCEKCGLRFSQANLLYNHKMHHDAEEKPLVCSKCDQTFKSKKTYSHHMVTHQEDRPMYPCEVCGKQFTEKYTLKVHLKTHRDANEEDPESIKVDSILKKKPIHKEFICIICDIVFSAKDMLESHMAAEHDVIGPDNFILNDCISFR